MLDSLRCHKGPPKWTMLDDLLDSLVAQNCLNAVHKPSLAMACDLRWKRNEVAVAMKASLGWSVTLQHSGIQNQSVSLTCSCLIWRCVGVSHVRWLMPRTSLTNAGNSVSSVMKVTYVVGSTLSKSKGVKYHNSSLWVLKNPWRVRHYFHTEGPPVRGPRAVDTDDVAGGGASIISAPTKSFLAVNMVVPFGLYTPNPRNIWCWCSPSPQCRRQVVVSTQRDNDAMVASSCCKAAWRFRRLVIKRDQLWYIPRAIWDGGLSRAVYTLDRQSTLCYATCTSCWIPRKNWRLVASGSNST